jgi:hypothetical protein
MKNSIIIVMALVSSPALAQTQPDWSHGACYENGIYFPARAFGECVSSDRHNFAQTMPPMNLMGATSVLGGNVTVTNASRNCPADRTVVMVGAGTFKCAKDLTDAE